MSILLYLPRSLHDCPHFWQNFIKSLHKDEIWQHDNSKMPEKYKGRTTSAPKQLAEKLRDYDAIFLDILYPGNIKCVVVNGELETAFHKVIFPSETEYIQFKLTWE